MLENDLILQIRKICQQNSNSIITDTPTLISISLKQHLQDYQRHIAVLKESLCAKEEHYNMLQADVDELRTRLEEKNRLIEKKTQSTLGAVQDRNRMQNELTELKDHMDIKDRKINVLQRKVMSNFWKFFLFLFYG